jgi:hypothetical protein
MSGAAHVSPSGFKDSGFQGVVNRLIAIMMNRDELSRLPAIVKYQ